MRIKISAVPLVLAVVIFLSLAMLSYAQVLSIPAESMILSGNVVSVNGTDYRITSDETLYVSVDGETEKYRRVFLEDIGKTLSLEKKAKDRAAVISAREKEISNLESGIASLESSNADMNKKLDSLVMESVLLSGKSFLLGENLTITEKAKSELQSRISGNFLVSRNQSYVAIIAFAALLVAVLYIELVAYLGRGKKDSSDKEK